MIITPAIRVPNSGRARVFSFCSLCACVYVASSARAELEFVPAISGGIAHTDNLTLASENEEPQTVYELIPTFRLSQHSPRVTSSASYRAEGYYYQQRGENAVYHFINGDLRVAPDPDNFFLDIGATCYWTIRDPS